VAEEDLGCIEPEAFKLAPTQFKSPIDYVRNFVAEVRKLHTSDAKNESRRKESLGHIFKTENLQPRAFRRGLLNDDGSELDKYFLTAFVPVLRESYHATFKGTKRPTYNLQSTKWLENELIFGALTAEDCGMIPGVTICEQFNDLRVDPDANHVVTYIFKSMDASRGQV